ncbi:MULTISPECIES: DUF1348 family protein [unclassified Streptomyces]|uniref:DUF1348 family protein n=1 Tax=unclassified Streptomyces TaxID=2593676 RepID=UPI00336A66C8
MSEESRPPFPPFTRETAIRKVRAAEDGWNSRDPGKVALTRCHASINDLPIKESERRFHWPLGRRPDDHPGLSDLGL